MRVLIVNTYYFPNIIGGAEISVKKLAEGLVDKGIEVHVICTGTENLIEEINGVKVHRTKLSNIYQPIELRNKSNVKKLIGRANDIYNILNKRKLKEVISRISPDIIHVNNIYGISPVIWDVAKEMNIKVVHTIRDYYLMCPRISMMKDEKTCSEKNIVCKYFSDINKKASHKVDFVTAPSQFTLDIFLKDGFFNVTKSKKVFNAIDFEEKLVEEIYNFKSRRNEENIKFVFMGTLSESKGIKLLLEAFSEIKKDNIQLLIAGKGPLETMVNEYCKKDKRIIYKGFMKEEEINNMLKKSDILIAPSIWNEPFGRVVIDGYKNVMPVIAGSYGGLKEIVKDGLTGKLIEPRNKQEFIESIEYFCDTENIKKMLNNCSSELKNYSIECQVEEFINIYKLLGR